MIERATADSVSSDPNEAAPAAIDGAPRRVSATPEALALIEELRAEYGPVMFHQSGGCCDGSSPMCYPVGDFITSEADIRLGEVGGAEFFISRSQFAVWQHTRMILDVVPGRGGMFSLENGREKRFHIRSRILSEAEKAALGDIACEIPQRPA